MPGTFFIGLGEAIKPMSEASKRLMPSPVVHALQHMIIPIGMFISQLFTVLHTPMRDLRFVHQRAFAHIMGLFHVELTR